jgi:hypothetical protein
MCCSFRQSHLLGQLSIAICDCLAGHRTPVPSVTPRRLPVALHRFLAERSGAKDTREVAGASHALSVSAPDVVTASILDALSA